MSSDKFASMIGFAKRAGKIVYGYDNIKSAKRIKVLAVSDSASDNLKDAMERAAAERNISLIYAPTLEITVGNNCKAVGVADENMAKAMTDYAALPATEYRLNRTVTEVR